MPNPTAIGDVLSTLPSFRKAAETLRFKKKWLNQGFTQISNATLRDSSISPIARLLYTLLMGRCFQRDFSYPGQVTLSHELGISERQVRRYLKELETKKWIEVKRRGLSKTNLYFLLKI